MPHDWQNVHSVVYKRIRALSLVAAITYIVITIADIEIPKVVIADVAIADVAIDDKSDVPCTDFLT